MKKHHLIALIVCGGSLAFGDALVTDRPDATESSSTIEGTAQIEAGWTYTENGAENAHAIPQVLLRLAVSPTWELRFGWDGYLDTPSDQGSGDGEFGTKIFLLEEKGNRPETALLAAVSVPVGDDRLTSDEYDPGFRFSCAHTLSDTLSFGYNFGVEWATEAGTTLSSFIYTAAVGKGLTEELGAYIEVFGDTGINASGDSHSLNGGFTYLMSDDLQFDVFTGVGLTSDSDDWFAGAGMAYRIP